MTENKQDALLRAYATLLSLRKNIVEMRNNNIHEKYVQEYHAVLDRLKSLAIDVAEFRISDSEVSPIDVSAPIVVSLDSGNRLTPPHYSKEKYVDKSFILMKLDAILGYFEIVTSEKPRRIGFSKPEK
ncbi:hypothetical protein ACFLWI_05735 [Chloroflexota bacterium]